MRTWVLDGLPHFVPFFSFWHWCLKIVYQNALITCFFSLPWSFPASQGGDLNYFICLTEIARRNLKNENSFAIKMCCRNCMNITLLLYMKWFAKIIQWPILAEKIFTNDAWIAFCELYQIMHQYNIIYSLLANITDGKKTWKLILTKFLH